MGWTPMQVSGGWRIAGGLLAFDSLGLLGLATSAVVPQAMRVAAGLCLAIAVPLTASAYLILHNADDANRSPAGARVRLEGPIDRSVLAVLVVGAILSYLGFLGIAFGLDALAGSGALIASAVGGALLWAWMR